MARGVRKTGGRRGVGLSTFSQGVLEVQFREHRELQTYRDFSPTRLRRGLAQDPLRLAGASVLGELILRHAESEGHPEIFQSLERGLDAMETVQPEAFLATLLRELWALIRGMGFGPLLTECVECGRPLGEDEMSRFDFGAGGLRCSACQGEIQGPRMGPVARGQLGGLLAGDLDGILIRPEAHLRLASDFITYHLSGGRPLRAMAVLADLAETAEPTGKTDA